MQTWTSLQTQLADNGLTGELVIAAKAMLQHAASAYVEWRRTRTHAQHFTELNAQLTVLSTIRRYLDAGHRDHNPGRRHYIASRDVVVDGLADDNGVRVQCPDAVCRAWYARTDVVSATKVDAACTCSCHEGRYQFHVRWRPCCDKPVDGGTEKKVIEIDTQNGMQPVIADDGDEARALLKELNLL